MYNFCTLFDSGFLSRGMALHKSLMDTLNEFRLYVLCMDEKCYEVLDALHLKNTVLIKLHEFETPQLLTVKTSRSKGEYCWTCTPFIIKYVLEKYDVSNCTYLDADLYFYNTPKYLLEEFYQSGKSVLITEHRYTPKYDQTEIAGKYCVQFMSFHNNLEGREVLSWWADRCLEWCYARYEEGKFGDQKYLDDWLERFDGKVHSLQHVGGGVAPWNIQQYTIDENLMIEEAPVVFYHFHQFKINSSFKVDLGAYEFSANDIEFIYMPYIKCINECNEVLMKIDNTLPLFQPFNYRNEELLVEWLKLTESERSLFNHDVFQNKTISIFGKGDISEIVKSQLRKIGIEVQHYILTNKDEENTISIDELHAFEEIDIIIVTILGAHDIEVIRQLEKKVAHNNRKVLIMSWKEVITLFNGKLTIAYDDNIMPLSLKNVANLH